MNKKGIFVGKNKLFTHQMSEAIGTQIKIGEEYYYKIANIDKMRPFFMSIISNSNHWMFIASNGGLSAGRTHRDNAFLPYYTDDKITESIETTGSKTLFKVALDGDLFLWEPFSNRYQGVYDITRNLYKSAYGNKIIFEEINNDLGITYQYHWNHSDRYGFIKKSVVKNNKNHTLEVEVLDGIQNILPYGIDATFQATTSNLIDAYKKNELEIDTGLGIYALSAIIVDKAEPSEALKATTIWSLGIKNATYLLSSLQLDAFRQGNQLHQEVDVKAEKGAYFVNSNLKLNAKQEKEWWLVADVSKSVSDVHQIKKWIKEEQNLQSKIQEDIDRGTEELIAFVGNADGIQLTVDTAKDMRHFSNTVFNIMRGGIFDNNYQIEKKDFLKYLKKANINVYLAKKELVEQFSDVFSVHELYLLTEKEVNANFKRLCLEYMPLKFSRRHGDPSRPWNKFSINMKSEIDGSKILDYEGNWRDIFQNWEALAHSYPTFINSMIHKFLNATTFDGYNPYRVTKSGFDWETIEADDPWSYIGYWGDHQVIYLLKLLEFSEKYDPSKLKKYFTQNLFVYANVPYKIKAYDDILNNPKDTIDFDFLLDQQIREDRNKLGADGALLKDNNGQIYQVNLIEKLLATLTAKLSNFIPEAGIWMNTQRPEWNDANNALVGNGVSMVTLYYLYRFLKFFDQLIENISEETVLLSKEFASYFNEIATIFNTNQQLLSEKISDKNRKEVMDLLGKVVSNYRLNIYKNGFSGDKESTDYQEIKKFINVCLLFLEHSIKANKRADKLFHSYNLITIEDDQSASISYLSEMLEGQVALLSSGFIDAESSLELLDALKESKLFRDDQYSYILYPNKELPRFIAKNTIPKSDVENSALLQELIQDKNYQIVEKDIFGNYHFNGHFNNANNLKSSLNNLPEKYSKLIDKEYDELLSIFEKVFNHKEFTGRSGTFFGYEGLGSIYWHMVSKLALAVQETCLQAIETQQNPSITGRLLAHYYEVYEGIGIHKPPHLYGAFPTDPYSHTPGTKGAQQPGMTGQVKEDLLTRFSELGIAVENGKLYFKPYHLLRKEEFLHENNHFKYIDVNGQKQELTIEKNSVCFTYCQVPIIYKISTHEKLMIVYKDTTTEKKELFLDTTESTDIFKRTGNIIQIEVLIKSEKLR